MNAWWVQVEIALRLHFRNRMALFYGYLFPLIFLVACPLCVAMDPMLWTQIDSGLLLLVS